MKSAHILPMERWKFFCYTTLAFFLSPVFFLVTRLRRRHPQETPKILVVPILTRVGDLICATPVFRAIKIAKPKAHLSVLVGKKIIDLIVSNPRIDTIINLNDIPYKGFFGRGRLFFRLFSEHFDDVILLTNNPFNNLLAFFSMASLRVKTVILDRSFAERLTDWMSNRRVIYTPGTFLQDHYIRLLSNIGISFSPPVKEVFPTKEGERKAEQFFSENGVSSGSFLVGICPSAGNSAKEWPAARFSELADLIATRYKAKIVFIDSPGNLSRVEEVITGMKQKDAALPPAVHFSLSEVPSVVKKLSVFIAVDTGLIYVAHALQVPLLDIIGPFHPKEQAPDDRRSIQVRPPKEIEPSLFILTKPREFSLQRQAVLSVPVSDVFEAFEELLNRGIISSPLGI